MKKILVTGANGYIGQRVVTYALDKGYQVVACDIKNTGIDARAIFCEESILSGDVDIYKRWENLIFVYIWPGKMDFRITRKAI